MTLTELKQIYHISKVGKQYRICDLEKGGRYVHKYYCSAEKVGDKFYVLGYEPTSKISTFIEQVNDYLSKLEYDSEYFYPDLREGVKEVLFVHDYINSLGFRQGWYGEGDSYIYKPKDVFGGVTTRISIWFTGLDYQIRDKLPKEVCIHLSTGMYSWITVKAKRDFKSLQIAIDSLLSPLLLSESAQNIKTAEKLEVGDVDFISKSLDGLNINSKNYKEELKNRLLTLANSL